MITEDYVSFEVAKLLKEKGFLKGVDLRMTQNLSFYDNIGLSHNLNKYYDSLIQDKIDFVVAPTHQMAMKFLREVYKLHITIKPYITTEGIMYVFEIYKLESDRFTLLKTKAGFEKSEEAVDAAIKDSIENLI